MVEAGRKMPLPRAKPPIPTEVASKSNAKSDKTDGKSENNKSEGTKSENTKSENGKSGEAKSKAGRSKSGS
jgi:hypothetical protein